MINEVRTRLGTAIGAILMILVSWIASAEAAGPWKAQIADADTGQPLEGVVVLAIWTARSPGLIHPQDEFHDVDELISDAQGRIVIPERSTSIPLRPLTTVMGPRILMFRAGYGLWTFQEVEKNRAQLQDAYFQRQAVHREWEKFASEGVVIVLRPLRTLEERRQSIYQQTWTSVPRERIPKFLDALSTERVRLGLGPE